MPGREGKVTAEWERIGQSWPGMLCRGLVEEEVSECLLLPPASWAGQVDGWATVGHGQCQPPLGGSVTGLGEKGLQYGGVETSRQTVTGECRALASSAGALGCGCQRDTTCPPPSCPQGRESLAELLLTPSCFFLFEGWRLHLSRRCRQSLW